MAKGIVVDFDGRQSAFDLTRLDRSKVYGSRKRVVVDERGEACVMATLTRDGAALLPPGCVGMYYLDGFEVCERGDLRAVDADGKPLPEVESTLGVPVPLVGPIPASRVLDHVAKAVYVLEPESLDEDLRERLARGEIFETRFNYRKGYDDAPAFLLQNDEGVFAILGEEIAFEYLRNEAVSATADDDADPFDDDLDFSF